MSLLPSPGTLFFIRHPASDESISSVLDRVGALYHMDRETIANTLLRATGHSGPRAWHVDWDNPPRILVSWLESAIGLESGALEPNRIHDGPTWLESVYRVPYCPVCFAEDLATGSSPYFRREWAKIYTTMCQTHGSALFAWPRGAWSWMGRGLPFDWSTWDPGVAALCRSSDTDWPGASLGQALITHETILGAAIEQYGDISSCRDAETKKMGEVLVSVAVESQANREAGDRVRGCAGMLMPGLGGWNLASKGPRPLTERPTHGGLWTRLRRVAHPGERRAAIFLTGVILRWALPLTSVERPSALDRDVDDLRCRILWPRLGHLRRRHGGRGRGYRNYVEMTKRERTTALERGRHN